MRCGREAGQVQHAAGAVADMGQDNRRHVAATLVQRGRDAARAVHEAHAVAPAQQPRQAVQHVHVRAKIGALCARACVGSKVGLAAGARGGRGGRKRPDKAVAGQRAAAPHWPAGLGSACGAGVRAAGAGAPVMMSRLSGRSCSAAAAALNRFSVVESATSTSEACAPMRPASLAPTRCGRRSQSCLFQEAIRSAPHSACTTCRRRARPSVAARRASRAAGGLGARARLAHALGRGPGQGAQGVAVEVDEAVGQQEALPEARQGVALVQALHVLQAQRARAFWQARMFSRRSVVGVWNHSACAS